MWESKIAPLSGALFGVLLLASFLVDANTAFMPPPEEIVTHLQDGSMSVTLGAYLRMLAAVSLIWFGASAHGRIKRMAGDRLALLAFGGGAVAGTLIAVGSVATIASAERMAVTGAIDAGAATVLFDIAGIATGNGAPLGFALLVGAAGIAILRTVDLPSWIGWVSVLTALGLVSPIGWTLLAVVLIWIPAAGIWLYRTDAREPLPVAA